MVRNIILTFLVIMTMVLPESYTQNIAPEITPLKTRVYYSVFVQSFYDSNGDGIGDIKGLISKLDYLKDLGIGGLWLLPVHPSPSYHKYDITDYYSIHPDYGTLDDYKNLVKEAHKRDMTILLDLVINHTSNLHPWFVKASKSQTGNYRDYYIWTEDQKEFDANPFNWHKVRDSKGKQLDGPRYYGFFWWEMPDLNFDNPKVRMEMVKVAQYWLKEVGVDGFRLDAARYIYGENEPIKNLKWWNEFSREVREIKPDAFIVGEVWGSSDVIAPYLANGLSACFNFRLSDSIRLSLKEEKDHYILQTWWQTKDVYEAQKPDYQDAIFLTNHDMDRIMTEVGNNPGKAKVAASILLTLPGNPFIYYGEEIGMLGEKPDEFIREPFLWDIEGKDIGQTHWEMPYASSSKTLKPLKFQMEDQASLYHYYKDLIRCRNGSIALQSGWFQPLKPDNRTIIAFRRIWQNEIITVLINLSGQVQKLPSPPGINNLELIFSSHDIFKSGAGTIYLQPYSTFILSNKI